MVLRNYIELQDGVPARFHFFDHSFQDRTIISPDTNQPTLKRTLVMNVDRLNGLPIQTVLTTMAEKLASQFEPYLADKSYTRYEFVITQRGNGMLRKWTVMTIPVSP